MFLFVLQCIGARINYNYISAKLPFSKIRAFRAVFVGPPLVGKSQLIHQITNNELIEHIIPLPGPRHTRMLFKDENLEYFIDFIDPPGDPIARDLTLRYINGSTLVILIYDVTNLETFNTDVMYWAAKIHESNSLSHILLANKTDLPNRTISKELGEKYAKQFLFSYCECSAITEEGIKDILKLIKFHCKAHFDNYFFRPDKTEMTEDSEENSYYLPFDLMSEKNF